MDAHPLRQPLLPHEAQKAVSPVAGANAVLTHHLPEKICNAPQHLISGADAENIVVNLEILHIGADNCIGSAGAFVQAFLHLLIEVFPAEQPCQAVIHKLIDHGGILPQLNQIGRPVENNLGTVGLWHEIGCPMRKCVYFILLAAALGRDHHRDKGHTAVGTQAIQKGIAIHHRHNHVQEDEGNAVFMLFQNLQRHLTVLSLYHIILLRQNLAQQLAVQFIVFYNKHPFFTHPILLPSHHPVISPSGNPPLRTALPDMPELHPQSSDSPGAPAPGEEAPRRAQARPCPAGTPSRRWPTAAAAQIPGWHSRP